MKKSDSFKLNHLFSSGSMRMLMNQHVLLFEQDAVRSDRRVGIIDLKCNIAAVVKQAYEEAAILCEKNYSIAPEIHVQVHEQLRFPAEDGSSRRIVKERTKGPLFLVYPPTHLKHIFIELLKVSEMTVRSMILYLFGTDLFSRMPCALQSNFRETKALFKCPT